MAALDPRIGAADDSFGTIANTMQKGSIYSTRGAL